MNKYTRDNMYILIREDGIIMEAKNLDNLVRGKIFKMDENFSGMHIKYLQTFLEYYGKDGEAESIEGVAINYPRNDIISDEKKDTDQDYQIGNAKIRVREDGIITYAEGLGFLALSDEIDLDSKFVGKNVEELNDYFKCHPTKLIKSNENFELIASFYKKKCLVKKGVK